MTLNRNALRKSALRETEPTADAEESAPKKKSGPSAVPGPNCLSRPGSCPVRVSAAAALAVKVPVTDSLSEPST